jgi:hypothetical protein|tara:strand:- start:161 stop:628 length:468 start_codon:yes stop_codon:yes gene_type:complete
MKKLILLSTLYIVGCTTASTPLERMERNNALSNADLCWEIFMGGGEERKEQETEALSRGADCTLYAAEIAERRRRQIVMGQALMNLSNQIKANSAAIGQSVDTSGLKDYSKVGQRGVLKSQTVSGSNRLCYYDVLGSVKVLNVPSVKICPISHRF